MVAVDEVKDDVLLELTTATYVTVSAIKPLSKSSQLSNIDTENRGEARPEMMPKPRESHLSSGLGIVKTCQMNVLILL